VTAGPKRDSINTPRPLLRAVVPLGSVPRKLPWIVLPLQLLRKMAEEEKRFTTSPRTVLLSAEIVKPSPPALAPLNSIVRTALLPRVRGFVLGFEPGWV